VTSKKALIFGVSGQDGCLLAKSLLLKGFRVTGVSRKDLRGFSNFTKLGINNDIELIQSDVEKKDEILKLIEKVKPDEIYNLAAQSSVSKSFSHSTETIDSIVTGTLNILEASKKIGYDGRMFFAGSSEIFGHTEKAACIDTRHQPRSPYGVGKQASFNLVKIYRESFGLNCVTGILFNHESSLRKDNFVTKKIIKSAIDIKEKKYEKIELGNISIVRDWGWAAEYVEAMQLILRDLENKDQIICTGQKNSLNYFVKRVFDKLDLNWENHVHINKDLFRPNEIMQSYGNPEKLFRDLGWRPKIHIEAIVDMMINDNLQSS
tara:strand:+ start:233 stop:1192 length:960 start_codon:yes stop_codon:yes gene_type:complete